MVDVVAAEARPDVPPEQRSASDLAKLIRKLRWIGLEEEAKALQRSLRAKGVRESVLAGPAETD
jgi:hypothetical protein